MQGTESGWGEMARAWLRSRYPRPGTRPMLAIIIAASVLLRMGVALYLGHGVEPVSGAADQVSYSALAERVAAGHGFTFAGNWWPLTRAGEPTAHWSFVYTLFLAGFYKWVLVDPLYPRLFQAVLVGVAQPLLVYKICQPFGQTVGLVAALVSAVYGYFVFYAAALVTESFFIVGILASILLAIDLAGHYDSGPPVQRSETAKGTKSVKWFLLGLVMALSTLLRQTALFFYPFLLAWIMIAGSERHMGGGTAWRGRALVSLVSGSRRFWRGAALATAVIILLIVPWTIRNFIAFDEFVPLNTNSGFAFFWANHPVHGTDFVAVLPDSGPTYASLIPEEWKSLNEAALDRRLLWAGIGYAAEDPWRYAMLTIGRAREYFKFWPTSTSTRQANLARMLSFGISLPFMLTGLIVTVGRSRAFPIKNGAIAVAWLLILFAAVHSSTYVLTWGLIRYRLPADAAMVPFTAIGAVFLTRYLFPGRLTPQSRS